MIELIILLFCIFIYSSKKEIDENWDYQDFINQDCTIDPYIENTPRFGGIPNKSNFWTCLRTIP